MFCGGRRSWHKRCGASCLLAPPSGRDGASKQLAPHLKRRRLMKPSLLNLFSTLSILLLAAVSQSSAQTQQRENRSRTASISGRVTIAGKPAANAVITVMETDSKHNPFGGLVALIPLQAKTRTDGDGRYLV